MTARRFEDKYELNPGAVRSLPSGHPAMVGKRTLFPNTVVGVTEREPERLLVSGRNNRKLGETVANGAFKGYALYGLSLEERATCPAYCPKSAASHREEARREHMRHLAKERWKDPVFRAKWTEANRKRNTPELRAATAKRAKEMWADPQRAAAVREKIRATRAKPENVKRDSERLKALWRDPEWRVRQSKAIKAARTEKFKHAVSDGMKERWADPEWKARQKKKITESWVRRKANLPYQTLDRSVPR